MEELLEHFGINWKLLLAQAINFSILFFVLRKYAYGPLVSMMASRKAKIEEGLRMREQAERELASADAMKAETLQAAQKDGLAIISKAEKLAKERQALLVAEANKKAEGIIADTKRILDQEQEKMNEAVYQSAAELVKSGMAKVIGKSGEKIEQSLINEALQELKSVNS